jgi:phosphate transport system permease protein
MSCGNAATSSLDLFQPLRTLSATLAAELGEVSRGSAHYHVLFFIGVVLFVITFVINLVGHTYAKNLEEKLSGRKK